MSNVIALTPQQLPTRLLQIQGLGKGYRLYDTPFDRLRALLGLEARYTEHWALQEVSFQLYRGQCLGVIGDNGAGKSTLLKLMAGTLQPSKGTLQRVGRVTAILELGAGFHPEFTGRENLHFAGGLMGFSKADLQRLEPSILAFSELGEAIDRPVKTYSSGMVVRLAFALVTAEQPELLIIDEALAVGDQLFQKKCIERIEQFRANGCTTLFCSHSMYHVRQLCERTLWLEKGRIKALGPTDEVIAAYELDVGARHLSDKSPADFSPAAAQAAPATLGGGAPRIVEIKVLGLDDSQPPLVKGGDLSIELRAWVPPALGRPNFGVMLETAAGQGITSVATHVDNVVPHSEAEGVWACTLVFEQLPLFSGQYTLGAYLFDSSGMVVYEERLRAHEFRVVWPSTIPGIVRLPHRWQA